MDLEAAKIPPMQAPRSHLLLSCGESISAVAHKAYQRVETMSCPVGCLARGVSHVAAPILSPLQLRCLSALSFVDRQLAVVQDVATVFFPRSERVFRKVDALVLLMESLPVRFDGAVGALEAFVAGVKSGAVMGFAPKRCCRPVVGEGDDDDDVFRDIQCDDDDDEEEGALHRATVDDESRAMESVVVLMVDDGGGTGDPIAKAIGVVGAAEKIVVDNEHTQKTERDVAVHDTYEKATHPPETEEPEVIMSSGVTERALEAESEGVANPMKLDAASGGEERVEGLKQDGRAMEAVEGAVTPNQETMDVMQEIVSVESREVVYREWGDSCEMGEAISEIGRESKEDALLYLFDEAWQQKLA